MCAFKRLGAGWAAAEVWRLYPEWEVHEGLALGRSGGILVMARRATRAHFGECCFEVLVEGRLAGIDVYGIYFLGCR